MSVPVSSVTSTRVGLMRQMLRPGNITAKSTAWREPRTTASRILLRQRAAPCAPRVVMRPQAAPLTKCLADVGLKSV